MTSLFLIFFKIPTSPKIVPYKAFLIKHNVCKTTITFPESCQIRTRETVQTDSQSGRDARMLLHDTAFH